MPPAREECSGQLNDSSMQPSSMQPAATAAFGLGLVSDGDHVGREEQGTTPRRDSTETAGNGSDSTETWGDFDAFSPLIPRHYRLYAPSASSRSTSPANSAHASPQNQGKKEIASLQPRTTIAHPAAHQPIEPLGSFLSPTRAPAQSQYGSIYQAVSLDDDGLSRPPASSRVGQTYVPQQESPCHGRLYWAFPNTNQGEHVRNLSLTTACPPAMAKVSPSKHKRDAFRISSSISVSPSKGLKKRNEAKPRWRPFTWTDNGSRIDAGKNYASMPS